MTSMQTAADYQGLVPVRLSTDARAVELLDQRELPVREVWLELRDIEGVAQAIETLAVRGAPAIGIAAAYGLAAASHDFPSERDAYVRACEAAIERLARTRPTAVNLFHVLAQMRRDLAEFAASGRDVEQQQAHWVSFAVAHAHADLEMCLRMGAAGGSLIASARGVLTHCNTGALATAGFGTALGVIRRAWADGARFRVFADETRPVLQGARLTAWELARDGIDVTLICDNMAGWLMKRGEIQAAVVGADRITRRGDVANKIGTYSVAVLCKHHNIPFYVAAPWTTIDPDCLHGDDIEIEERHADEVRLHGGKLLAPPNVRVFNPAFDVAPAELVTAIITDRGVFAPQDLSAALS